ncbi:MAG: thiol reductant ABC exporter subunit CydC [Granulosicoccus sp.]
MTEALNRLSGLSVFFRLLLLYRPYWGWMALGVLLSLITVLANVALMALAGWFISIMAIAGLAGTSVNYFTPSAAIRGLALTRTAGRYFERVVSHEATLRLLSELRQWFYSHLEPIAPAVLQGYRSGDILSRISADIDTLQDFYLRIVSPIIVALLAGTIYGIFLSRYNMGLLIAVLSMLFVAGVVIPITVYRLAGTAGKRQVQTSTELRLTVVDSIQGMAELQIYGFADEQINQTRVQSGRLLRDQKTQAKYTGISQALVGLCANCSMWLVLLISIPLLESQQLQAEDIVLLALFALASFELVVPLPAAFQLLPKTLAAAQRIFEIADSKAIITEPDHPLQVHDEYAIHFDHVCFSYNKQPSIRDLSFKLKTGNRLALRGASGVGKSTVINLLVRFWGMSESDSGCIRFGGYPIHQYHSDDIRKCIAVLPQQTVLFNNTIKNNLLLAKPDANDNLLEEVCRVACIHEFITTQPDGYDTWVGEAGLMLSGGQARRICVARVLLKDSPVFILDEPGEGLDADTERKLLAAVFSYKKNASILLITHKNAGLDLVDEVINMV